MARLESRVRKKVGPRISPPGPLLSRSSQYLRRKGSPPLPLLLGRLRVRTGQTGAPTFWKWTDHTHSFFKQQKQHHAHRPPRALSSEATADSPWCLGSSMWAPGACHLITSSFLGSGSHFRMPPTPPQSPRGPDGAFQPRRALLPGAAWLGVLRRPESLLGQHPRANPSLSGGNLTEGGSCVWPPGQSAVGRGLFLRAHSVATLYHGAQVTLYYEQSGL